MEKCCRTKVERKMRALVMIITDLHFLHKSLFEVSLFFIFDSIISLLSGKSD